MKKTLILFMFCLTALLFGCEPIENNNGGKEMPILPEESYGVEIGTFYVENRNMTLRLMVMQGASPSQLKPVRIITNEYQRRFFFKFVEEEQ